MPRAVAGTLVQCDPSIKALILQIDLSRPGILVEELSDTHLLINSSDIQYVKNELNRLLSKNIYNPFDDA